MSRSAHSPRNPRRLTGFHAIAEALKSSPGRGVLLLSRSGARHRELEGLARGSGVEVRRVTDQEVERECGSRDHRGAVLVVALAVSGAEPGGFDQALRAAGEEASLVVVLDGVTDPRNLGAILRSADQFSVDLVVLPERRSAHITGVVETTSAGASSHVRIAVVKNLVRVFDLLRDRGFWIYGAHLEGERLDGVDLGRRTALVLGSEGKGLSRLVRERVDGLVRIPTAGNVGSLNVSVAAGILLYEVRRRHGAFGR